MKRILAFALPAVLTISFAAAGFAQQTTRKAEKKQTAAPASTDHKAATEQKATMSATETLQLNKDEITALQNALVKAGAYKGKANGMLDSATKTGIRKYQTDHMLKVTGEPNRETLHKLGVTYAAPTTKPAAPSMEHSTEVKKEAGKKSQAETQKPQ
ncbi:MAG: peptidoglycan-binding domain-containing protein [bacterium]